MTKLSLGGKNIKNCPYDICIIGGLGRIGLPLGISFAQSGKKVVLYDINHKAIEVVSQGKMPFNEIGAEKALKDVIGQNLFISSNKQVLLDSYFLIFTIGTPVDEYLNPKFTVFMDLFKEIFDVIRDEQHIILRSTIFPGTTENIKNNLEQKGRTTKLSFCPERIAEGKAMEELRTLPQIISSFDEDSLNEAKELFSLLANDIITLSPAEAELAKLFANVWRYIHFAVSNQFYEIATQHNLDFYNIYNAIVYKYPRAESFSPAGFAAGPCLFKDTMQLAAFSNNSFFLGHAAMLINEGLPNFIVQQLKDKYQIKGMTVGILGMAFKANSDDRRESLSYKLKKILELETQRVLCNDVYISEEGFVPANIVISEADIIILATPHKDYANLDIKRGKIVVDIWNFYGKGGLF